jgi:hypothetical protein
MNITKLLITCSLITLSACSSSTVKDTLGINRKAPDEFRVVSRPPLYIPPQFNLRPPSSSAESPTIIPADKQAKSLVLDGKPANNNGAEVFSLKQGNNDTAVTPVTSSPLSKSVKNTGSKSDQQFLKNIGAEKSDPKVRDELVEQAIVKQEKIDDSPWWDIFPSNEKKEPLVNSKAEADRIKTNKETGKSVTEGDTPEVKSGDRGWLREWLGW